jgi:hypothetical protein
VRVAAVLVLTIFVSVAAHSVGVTDMRLVDVQVGWATTSTRLYWTSDGGGHWTDITPQTPTPMGIGAVFFLNSFEGWVLLAGSDNDIDGPRFALASTASAEQVGRSGLWSYRRLLWGLRWTAKEISVSWTPLMGG